MAATISAADVIARAVAMPLASPAYPAPPDRFLDRLSLTVTYRSDIHKVTALVPEPLTVADPIVSIAFLFMRAPKLGDYYEVAQSISTELYGEPLLFRPAMYAGSVAAVLQGREWWGLPKKFGAPMVRLHNDTLVGTLDYSGAPVARATMAYGHQTMEPRTLNGRPVRPGSCSRSSRMSTANRESSNLSGSAMRTSSSKRPTRAPVHWSSIRTRWRPWRSFRCRKSCL
jgi:acetoacetate decarboxylase